MRSVRHALITVAFTTVGLLLNPGQASAVTVHTATFAGPYSTKAGTVNNATTCRVGVTTGPNDCLFSFPSPSNACVADGPTTPSFGKASLTIGTYMVTVALFRKGGGVFEGIGATLDGTNTTVWFVHISVAGLCDEDLDAALDNTLQSLDLTKPTYQFAGYADA